MVMANVPRCLRVASRLGEFQLLVLQQQKCIYSFDRLKQDTNAALPHTCLDGRAPMPTSLVSQQPVTVH